MRLVVAGFMRILLVEDDPALATGMKHGLEQAGYEVDWAAAGTAAVSAALTQEYCAILLDLSLGGKCGMSALRDIRSARNQTPVLIITANDARSSKLEGLNAGADDYITKPFDLDEVLARIRVHVRRRDGRASNALQVGIVRLDLDAKVVRQDGQVVAVTAKEQRVLGELMRNAGRFVSKSELEAALYDDQAEIESNTIEVAIYGLRRKLGGDFIMTARGLGYMCRP
jgi:DNA-binding response OmpR family regulator